jgi:hypothetical protein
MATTIAVGECLPPAAPGSGGCEQALASNVMAPAAQIFQGFMYPISRLA